MQRRRRLGTAARGTDLGDPDDLAAAVVTGPVEGDAAGLADPFGRVDELAGLRIAAGEGAGNRAEEGVGDGGRYGDWRTLSRYAPPPHAQPAHPGSARRRAHPVAASAW